VGLKLLDLSSREEKVSEQDDNEEKTTWTIGPCSTRQMFAVYSKYAGDGSELTLKSQVGMAFDLTRLGLKAVKGPLSAGFSLSESSEFPGDSVAEEYLDRLPISLVIEIGGWVGEVSQVGTEGKKD